MPLASNPPLAPKNTRFYVPANMPIPGTTKLHRLEENVGAANVELTSDDLSEINEAASNIEAEGERYAPQQLAMVGREAPPAGRARR